MGQLNLLKKKKLKKDNFEDELIQRVDASFQAISANSPLVDSPVKYALNVRGKCVRPILMYLTADALGLDYSKFDKIAAAIEALHTYSLVHDDLPCMDDDDLRRGVPTLHKKFNESTAVLVGDALQTLAYQLIAEDNSFSDAIKIQIIKELTNTIGLNGMIKGQFLDLEFENISVSKAQIIDMNILKTSLLIESSMNIPLLTAKNKDPKWNKLARLIGLSFQITDDIIDLTQPTELLGKTAQKDLSSKKKTLPLTLGMEEAIRELEIRKTDAMNLLEELNLAGHLLKSYVQELFTRVK